MDEIDLHLICDFPLFRGYTEDGARRFIEAGEIRSSASGESLFIQGDPPDAAFLVLEGSVEVFVNPQGRELVISTARPGDIVGELGVLGNMPRSASARMVDGSRILRWESRIFRSLLLGDSHLSRELFASAVRNLLEHERALIDRLAQAEAALADAGES